MLRQRSITLSGALPLAISILFAAIWASPGHASALGPDDPPEPTSPETAFPSVLPPELKKPIIPAQPTQADLGSITWWGVCMACHGDKGQGLTDEWRALAFGEDMNCWKSKCHAPNFPPGGFVLVRQVPPAIGPGTWKRFVTAADLQHYLKEKMPWWKPGSLSESEAWQLTAYLMRSASLLPVGEELAVDQANFLAVHLPVRPVQDERGWQIVLFGVLSLAAVGMFSLGKRSFTDRANDPDSGQVHGLSRSIRTERPSFFHHLHPPTIPLPQARLSYTLGAGGLAVFFSLVLASTGILEMFFYIPTPEQAGPSIQSISYAIPFGMLVRGLHFWAAQALVIVAVIHLLRVVLTGAFTPPRRFNYLLGLCLLVVILLLDFTGYVLRWDEGIRWALMVGTNLLKTIPLVGERIYSFVVGGEEPGLATLNRFYAWHIFGLTLIVIAVGIWHIFRVRRDGGIAAPPPELRSDPRRLRRDDLVQREVLAMTLATAGLILVVTLIPPPIAPPISDPPIILTEEVRAPWFFLWIQQLLRHGDAFWMGVGIPLAMLSLLVVLPYLIKFVPGDQRGRWLPRAGRLAQILAIGVVLGWLALTILELFT